MKHNENHPILKIGMALCLVGCITGCGHSDPPPAAPATVQQVTPSADGTKPKGGNLLGPTTYAAPAGVQTGNYAGGKKN